jgi:SAM-dependent methyltransferase
MSTQFSDIFQQLESWYGSDRGVYLLHELQRCIQPMLDTTFGYHIVQLGPPAGRQLLAGSPIHHRIYAAPQAGTGAGLLCRADELPLQSDSVDAVVALNCLEFADNPHQVLRELQRVLTPQGHLLLAGFNPWSVAGAARRIRGLGKGSFWRHQHPVGERRLTDWLHLLGCEVQDRRRLYALPPVGGDRLRRATTRIDKWCSRYNLPVGGVYVLHAIKQVAAVHRPRQALRRERLIGLAVPKAGAAPSPTPTLPTRGRATMKQLH